MSNYAGRPKWSAFDTDLSHANIWQNATNTISGHYPGTISALGLSHPVVAQKGDVIYDVIMLKLVMDTDVMVAAFDSPNGASRQVLLDVLDGKARLALSTPLILEYEAVLTRPKVLAMTGLTVAETLSVLDEVASVCAPVTFDYHWRPAAADPNDDLVLETAINGVAEVIATFNAKHLATAAHRFGIAVERPALVLRRIRL